MIQAGPNASYRDRYARDQLPISELPLFLNGSQTFDVPVYTVWGACEDVAVLEKLRSGEYNIKNLTVVDEAHSQLLQVSGLKLRLLGLGGAVVMHKLFDNGEGKSTIAGGQGTMWTTLLQIGQLVDTAQRLHDPSETRILITHASPARESLLNQLAVALKVDFSISAGLHFRYGSSYNEFSVNPTLDHYRGKLAASKASFQDVWETVKGEVEPQVSENEDQRRLLSYALEIVNKMPETANGGNHFGGRGSHNTSQVDELAFKNMWNFNLADAAFGYLVLEVEGGRIGTEMRAQGFNFAHRGQKTQHPALQADMIKQSAPSPMTGGQGQRPASNMSGPSPYVSIGQPQQDVRGSISQAPQGFQQQRSQPSQAPTGRTPQPTATPTQPPQPQKAPSQPTRSQPAVSSTVPTPAPAPQAAPAPPAQPKSTPATTNGSAPTAQPSSTDPEKDAAKTADAPTSTPANDTTTQEPPRPSTSIFVQNVSSEEEARNLFSEEDRTKITRAEKRGPAGSAMLLFFNSHEDQQAVWNNAPSELKTRRGNAPNIKEGHSHVQDRSRRPYDGAAGAGTWGRSSVNPAARSNGTPEGEAGRGRGGFGRGRGRGRGDGERGRGGRGGRGGVGKEGGATGAVSGTAAAVSAAGAGGA